MKRSIKLAVLTVAMMLTATSMFAATVPTTNSNNVTVTVVGSCQWITELVMAFPDYDPFAVGADTQSTSVLFKCVKKTSAGDTYKIWFDKTGGNMANTVTPADVLAYTLTDSASNPLPTNAAGAVVVAGTPGIGVASGYTFTVNGSIAPNQDVPVGSYEDTVVANIEY
jgi:spore coat protein U-like protein